MTAQVFSFLRRGPAPRDWTSPELAEFYRVESALIQAGLWVVSARGLSDEGEPWFVFCRADDDEVIIHFARIDGRYVICAPAYGENAAGHDFRALVKSLIERNALLPRRPSGDNLLLHPATLLVVLVATALLKSGHAAEAATPKQSVSSDTTEGKHRDISPVGAFATAYPVATVATSQEAQDELLILAAMTAMIVAPAQAAPMATAAMSPLPDFDFQSHQTTTTPPQLDNAPALAPVISGTGGLSPSTPSLSVASPADATPSVLPHAVAMPDGALASALSPSGTLGTATPPSGSGVLTASSAVVSSPIPQDPSVGAQLVPLSTLSNIPKADLDLLHALSVPNTVAYAENLPAAFSKVVQTGVHADTVSLTVGHPSSGVDASAQSPVGNSAPQTATPTVAQAPSVPSGPNISTVLAIVGQFQAIEIHPALVLTANAAIFYDAAVVDANLSAVASVTYNFGDGFSISLVGLPAELAHAGAHM